MGDFSPSTEESQSLTSPKANSNVIPRAQPISLVQPSRKNDKDKSKVVRAFRSVIRAFPIINPRCQCTACPTAGVSTESKINSSTRVTGTLFGFHKGKVSLSLQENPKCLPWLVVELALQTNVLQKELSSGMVRIVLECEKKADKDKIMLLDEPLWMMYCNGKKTGYGVRREATGDDLNVMELLKAVSMGAGALPGNTETEGPDGELAYMRAFFERVIGSKDSQTYYMVSPDTRNGPELSIFLVRL
ncbi:hypothetical protein F3Y22_tig00110432pilonHSYRG00014 [Hibiscus syriacus]|uniref:Protein MIZU-KUSSEI 1 n=2 Tax=Hibiscus syriacus TaxID=106335 RepID=A0A6A3AK22_HIBSY|nr:hypothetical protein F3Y22_tig00110432pilonHSYRG00014 [Hibiscus syriacus]